MSLMLRHRLALLCLSGLLGLLTACGPDMSDQDRPDMDEPPKALKAPTSRMPVPGTVARGEHSDWDVLKDRPAMTPALLARGQERFNIYCAPCHGLDGYGDGLIPHRGFPAPPNFHTDRLRDAPDAHFLSVIANGFGVMFPYGDRVPASDRWAIVAYIRALQLSQHAEAAQLPETVREALK